ncbi:MAG: flagellar hook-associated protein FlgK [Clostridium sp.]|nr:flagellar hook-associated protein FlgK [Acetatifactor muris]MCM1526391.1 flagellar hook-associated protein FlgK [Bacteroides sp.]MCM1563246.1 flagellar hook-associated protein FlgK [Clostridium sp.]
MSSLYIGASGLQTSQNALNTTAHNLSNTDTVGYVRQQVQQSSKSYVTISKTASAVAYQQSGLGVSYSRVKQVRDYFLDKTFRKESGRSMFYEVTSNVMEEVESQLGEMNGEAFQGTMSHLWTAVQELAKDPASSVTQGLLVQRASEFVERAIAVYDGLSSYQDNLNRQILQKVDMINDYGKEILDLNERITAIECGGVEHANDLRDVRDRMLDELGELAKISFQEDAWGAVSVKIEGVDFVKGDICYEMGLDVDEATGFYTPFWPQNASYTVQEDGSRKYRIDGAKVFNLDIEISSDLDTDIGGLKAMLLARGDHRADYTDLDPERYDGVSQSVVMNIQAEFDQLIHNVVTKINSILADAAGVQQGDLEIRNEDGTTETLKNARFVESVDEGYMRDESGAPIRMFDKITTDAYRQVTGTDGKTYWVYNEEDVSAQDSLYTLKNLRINQELMQKPSSLGFRLEDGSEDQATADALKAAFTEEIYTLNPNVQKKTTFNDYYSDMVSQVANTGYVSRSIYESQQNTVESVECARSQVIGVSSDEELSNMIKFQNAYNASSRYINAISEMLEHIINTLGV